MNANLTEAIEPYESTAVDGDCAPVDGAVDRAKRDGGFTLIEVMVVVLIIGILLAVGVPTFLGARERAQDRAAQTSLRIAQSTAMVLFTDNANLKDADPANMSAAEPSIKWVDADVASSDPKVVSVNILSSTEWVGAAMSDSGTCYYIRLDTSGTVGYGSVGTCTGTAAAAASPSASW